MSAVVLTREQSRRVDQLAMGEFGFSGLVLMENAGRGVADVLCGGASVPLALPVHGRGMLGCRTSSGVAALAEPVAHSPSPPTPLPEREREEMLGPVAICCGKGNNAGDGFVIARHLDLRGHPVRVLLWAEPEELSGDAAANFHILKKTDVPIEVFGAAHDAARLSELLEDAAWIVDALLGTGARGAPRPPLDDVIEQINAARASKLAVDLPSGLDCDTGQPARPTIRAAVTCTFVAAKVGFAAPEAAPYLGRVHVLDIGTPQKLIESILE